MNSQHHIDELEASPEDRGEMPRMESGVSEVRVRSLREVEDAHVQFALRVFNGNKKRAAAALGISRDTLYRKIAESAGQPADREPTDGSCDGGHR